MMLQQKVDAPERRGFTRELVPVQSAETNEQSAITKTAIQQTMFSQTFPSFAGNVTCEKMDASQKSPLILPPGIRPYYQERDIAIICGDCREVLPKIEMADSVITDPPFGIDWGRATWDDDSRAYPELMCWLVSECNRLVKNGWCFVFQSMPNAPRFHEWFGSSWRIYAACKNFAQIRPTGVWHSWDPVVFWANGEIPREKDAVNRDYFVGNVAGVFDDGIEHPCPKPIDTMQHIVSIASSAGALIVDPFLGSGTTTWAAKQLGRKAIGIEICEQYCEIAARRLSQEVLDFK